jgi:methyl-accepting chemotaxis protein
MNWTIGRRITLGFAAVLVVVACIGVFSLNRVNSISRSNKVVTDNAMPSIVLFSRIESLVKGNYINTTQHLDATDPAKMGAIEKEMNEKSDKLTALYKEVDPLLTTDEAKRLYELIKPQRSAYRDVRTKVLALSREGKNAEAREYIEKEMFPVFNRYTEALQACIE